MKIIKIVQIQMQNKIFTALFITFFCSQGQAQTPPKLGKNSPKEVIAAMTLDEKVRLLVGMGMKMPVISSDNNEKKPPINPSPDLQATVIGSTQDKVAGAAGTTATFEHLGIPTIVVADGPAGLRIAPTRPNETKTFYATAFPIATLLASSWDTELAQKTGIAMGHEVKEYGVDIILGPGMNIHRNALGGRNFEYYSEDPLLTGKMAAAIVNGIQSNNVGTSIKHFAVNNFETNRNTVNIKISERALREIYLRGFEIAVKEANPWTVMSSYNKINGIYASESADLLKKILRQDWGYKGFVMTDWFGGTNVIEQMKAGNNLLMPGTPKQIKEITEAVKKGQLSEKILDENIEDMLNIIQLTPSFKAYQPTNQPNLKKNAIIAREIATEGMVLLKNEQFTLPLKKGQKIAAFGNYTYNLVSGGTGSGDVNEAYIIALTEGLKNEGFLLSENLQTSYETYIQAEKAKQPKNRPFFLPPPIIPEMEINRATIDNNTNSDVAIITIGRIAGEFADRKIENDYNLSATEKTLINNVSTAFHAKGKKVIVVLNIGGVIETASWRDKVDAILLAWLPGQEAGNAIAAILNGSSNPSGKLATTFLKRYEDETAADGFPGKEYGEVIDLGFQKVRAMETDYKEGIFVGYRGFDKQKISPAYEFGYGLSYTNFSYSDLKLSSKTFNNKITATVTIKNTGTVAGKEVVQLYLSAPNKTMIKPLQELKGFAKTKLLQPNESQILSFDLDEKALASFDEKASSWVAEQGTYNIKIGASSRNIKLSSKFKLSKTLQFEKVNKALEMK